MTVIPYSWYVPAIVTTPPAGARIGVPCWARMSRPLWNSVPDDHGDTRMPNSELTAPRIGHREGSAASALPARATSRSSALRLSPCSATLSARRSSSSRGESLPVTRSARSAAETAGRGRRDGDSDEGADGRRAGEVEPDDPGSVAADDEQAELFPVGPARATAAGALR